MRLEDIQGVVWDNIPELLNIGDYRGRVEKCIDILKNTRTKYDEYYSVQESDDVIEMLNSFLVEDEAHGFMEEHNSSALYEANKILNICKCCLYESSFHHDIPLQLVSSIRENFKVSIMDVKIGDILSDAIKNIRRYGVLYKENDKHTCIEIMNNLVWKNEDFWFNLYIYHDGSRINQFYLNTSNNARRWRVLSVIDEIFASFKYRLKELSKDSFSVSEIYSGYYDVANVYHSPSDTYIRIINAKQYEKENKSWWKI